MKNSNLIKERLRQILKEEINNQLQKKAPSKETSNLDLYLEKIPSLKNAVEKVLTPNYKHFLVDANVISPKPFTVRFKTKNGYHLELFLKDGGYKCKVSGKKYDLNTDGEIEKASESITELLALGKPQPISQDIQGDENSFDGLDSGQGSGLGGNFGDLPTDNTEGGDDNVFKPIDDKGIQNVQGSNDAPTAPNT